MTHSGVVQRVSAVFTGVGPPRTTAPTMVRLINKKSSGRTKMSLRYTSSTNFSSLFCVYSLCTVVILVVVVAVVFVVSYRGIRCLDWGLSLGPKVRY